MLGFLLQWPTILTLAMFPILVGMYVRLAHREEREVRAEFGEAYARYAATTPAFVPWLRRDPEASLTPTHGPLVTRRRTMLYAIESSKPLDRVAQDLQVAVARHKFGVLGVHDLRAKMAEKGVPFARECRIFEVCNPHQAKRVLEANLEISTALPCRISVYEEGGQTKLATIRPTALIALYASPELREVAEEVERTLMAIMAEAARV